MSLKIMKEKAINANELFIVIISTSTFDHRFTFSNLTSDFFENYDKLPIKE